MIRRLVAFFSVMLLCCTTLLKEAPKTGLDRVRDSVVMLSCYINNVDMGGGSGTVIWHSPGTPVIVLTAAHVTEGCRNEGGQLKIVELLNGKTVPYETKLEKEDLFHDTSIISSVASFKEQRAYLELDPSEVDFGQEVYTAGFPGMFRYTKSLLMTKGIINAPFITLPMCDEEDVGIESCFFVRTGHKKMDVIVTDAEIGPGNSGGVLLNNSYKLIGITVAGVPLGNMRAVCIPVKYAVEILKSLEIGKTIKYLENK